MGSPDDSRDATDETGRNDTNEATGDASTPDDAVDDEDTASTGPAAVLDRRRVLALSGVAAAGGLAGCGGDGDGDSGDGDGTTTGATETTAAPTTEATTAAPTTSSPTTTESPGTTDPTTEEPTTQPTTTASGVTDPTEFLNSPGSAIQPTDGFASAEWLTEVEPRIVKVTNLDAEGEGSLKAAIEMQEPRVVVFEVGGVIDLDSTDLDIIDEEGYDRIWIAGQTAPSPGITLVRGSLSPYARNSIVQHLRVRVGDDVDDAFDGISVGSLAENAIVDHCSVCWAIDENLSVDGGSDVGATTLSNNVIAEGLYDSIHPKGPHSKGSLINNNAPDVAVIGNIYSRNNERQPRLKGGTRSVVVNNMVYKFGSGVDLGADSEDPAQTSFVANHFSTPSELGSSALIRRHPSADMGQAYVSKTRITNGLRDKTGSELEILDERPLWPDGLEAMGVNDVEAHNRANAGARPADRTPQDERILEDAQNGSLPVVNSQEEVGGYPDLESTERTLDVPEWGTAFAEWISQHTRAVELGEDAPETTSS